MSANVEGKVVIVTGGVMGIGLATVTQFRKSGAKVAVFDVAESEEAATDGFLPLKVSVADEAQVNDAVQKVVDKWGKIDILVNNAGIMDNGKNLEDDVAVWRRVMSINLDGPMYMMRAAIPHILKNEGPDKGAIVNLCSAAAKSGGTAGTAYTASKHGLLGLTRSTAWLYRFKGIRCNAVLPGGVMTNIMQNSGVSNETIQDSLQGPELGVVLQTMPGVCAPSDIAGAIFYLASATSVNGAELPVDKGWMVA